MEEKRATALVGLQNQQLLETVIAILKTSGYECTAVRNPESMLRYAGEKDFSFYAMDANLGRENSPDISSLKSLYALERVRRRYESGQAKIIAATGNETALTIARSIGYQFVVSKKDFTESLIRLIK